ncbi:MAG: mechanosensitive ion channel family protein [Myxococcales bacterium]|nr:mechanosensitive ion channel family protein [Myxococcales bacterium]
MSMFWDLPEPLRRKLLATLVLLLGTFVVRWVVVRVALRSSEDLVVRYRWRKFTRYIAAVIIAYGLGRIWLQDLQSLTTMVGLVGAGLAIALQEPISNIAAWLHILTRRPFEIGDRIQVGSVRGDVIDQRVFSFTLLEIGNWVDADQSTGRVVHVPNARVFREPVASYSQGFHYIWLELPVTVTFESNWRDAKKILAEVGDLVSQDVAEEARRYVEAAANRYVIKFTHLTPIVYTRVVDVGITLTLRFLSLPQRRRSAEEKAWEAILDRFAEREDIDFAYPTTRFYDNVQEGKAGARAERS